MTGPESMETTRPSQAHASDTPSKLQMEAYLSATGLVGAATTKPFDISGTSLEMGIYPQPTGRKETITHDKQGDTITTDTFMFGPNSSQVTTSTLHPDGSSVAHVVMTEPDGTREVSDWLRDAKGDPPTSIIRDTHTGQISLVHDGINHTTVEFDQKTGQPSIVLRDYPGGAPLTTSVIELNPTTGKPNHVAMWHRNGTVDDYIVDPNTGKVMPETWTLPPLSFGRPLK